MYNNIRQRIAYLIRSKLFWLTVVLCAFIGGKDGYDHKKQYLENLDMQERWEEKGVLIEVYQAVTINFDTLLGFMIITGLFILLSIEHEKRCGIYRNRLQSGLSKIQIYITELTASMFTITISWAALVTTNIIFAAEIQEWIKGKYIIAFIIIYLLVNFSWASILVLFSMLMDSFVSTVVVIAVFVFICVMGLEFLHEKMLDTELSGGEVRQIELLMYSNPIGMAISAEDLEDTVGYLQRDNDDVDYGFYKRFGKTIKLFPLFSMVQFSLITLCGIMIFKRKNLV
ncbi:MAG: hypothetical protein IJM14_05495 [Lachnospiraceae bacterium]|nr:hypothetical protein [Lachnospiraceae bacterium]